MESISELRASEIAAKDAKVKRNIATALATHQIQQQQAAQQAAAVRDQQAQAQAAQTLSNQAFTNTQANAALGGQAQNLAYRDSTASLAANNINAGRDFLASANAQQSLSLDQRNTAVNAALTNAKAQSAPGFSSYDQSLQQMLTGSFAPNDPSYQWRLQQGTENLSRAGAAKGMLGSGNMAAELLNYGQNQASQEYQAQFQRLLGASQNATSQYATAYNALGGMLQQQVAQQAQGNAAQQVAQGWEQAGQGWAQQARGWDSQAQGWNASAQKWTGLSQGWNSQAQGWSGQGTNQGTLQTRFDQLALDAQQLGINQQQADSQSYNAGTNAYSAYQKSQLEQNAFADKTQRLNKAEAGAQQTLNNRSNSGGNSSGSSSGGVSSSAPLNGGTSYANMDEYYAARNRAYGWGTIQNSTASQLPPGTGSITNSDGVTTIFGSTPDAAPSYEPFTNDYGYSVVYGD